MTTKMMKTTTMTATMLGARLTRRVGHILSGLGIALAAISMVATVACKTGNGGTTAPGPRPAQKPDPVGPTDTKVARKYPAPPPPTAPKPVNFPDVATFRLANGLAVYVIENHEVPIVTTQLVVRCGTMDDAYLAEFTAQMLGEGTRSRSKARLDEAIEFVGGTLGASTGTHVTTVFARSLDTDLKLAVLLMADEVLNPMFPSAALDKLKQRAKAGLRISRSSPDALADTLFGMSVFPEGHPYGRPLATEAQIDAISIGDLRSFHETFYRANNAFLLLSGDITAAEARPLVERGFDSWAKAELAKLPPNPLNVFTRYELPSEFVVHLVDRPNSKQASIRIGNIALARNHEDWPELEVTNHLLGYGPNGRLFQDLREERGLTYAINSRVSKGQAPGTFVIRTQTRTPTTGAMLAGVFEHIERIRQDNPSQTEFDATVRTLVGSFPLKVETPAQIVAKVKEQIIYGLPQRYWQGYRDGITRVERSEIGKTARRYIHALPVVVVVGDAAAIRLQIEEVLPSARVIEYDDLLRRK